MRAEGKAGAAGPRRIQPGQRHWQQDFEGGVAGDRIELPTRGFSVHATELHNLLNLLQHIEIKAL
jgi:hypothetical protein